MERSHTKLGRLKVRKGVGLYLEYEDKYQYIINRDFCEYNTQTQQLLRLLYIVQWVETILFTYI